MDKFETLEDYQNSLKEFNERTRKSYEDFIQEYGDESQKLQLRCTPFTEKKRRYGVASLDFGFQIWQSRQAEIDRLEEWNSNQAQSIKTYQSEDKDLKALLQKLIDDEYTTMRPSMAYEIQKALRGDNA